MRRNSVGPQSKQQCICFGYIETNAVGLAPFFFFSFGVCTPQVAAYCACSACTACMQYILETKTRPLSILLGDPSLSLTLLREVSIHQSPAAAVVAAAAAAAAFLYSELRCLTHHAHRVYQYCCWCCCCCCCQQQQQHWVRR